MSVQLTAHGFLKMLEFSELLTPAELESLTDEINGLAPAPTPRQICDLLVQRRMITAWQADKLLAAKYRGFFLGPYKLLDRIARGAMSNIYAAEHRSTGERHALKVLPPARNGEASYLPRFLREADLSSRLQHPHIVRVFGVFSETDGQDPVHFMAMELLTGRDLAELVAAEGPLPVPRACEYIRQAALGLQHAHDAGLVHRDVKPGNLFLTTDDSIRLLDLGLAQDFDADESLTRDFNERVLGTADYLAPEQAVDSHAVDSRADIYSLGCTFYFLLTGQPPFTEGTLVQRLIAHQTKSPPPVSQFRNDVPDEIIRILTRMMARRREDRIATAQQVADELAAVTEPLRIPVIFHGLPLPPETAPDDRTGLETAGTSPAELMKPVKLADPPEDLLQKLRSAWEDLPASDPRRAALRTTLCEWLQDEWLAGSPDSNHAPAGTQINRTGAFDMPSPLDPPPEPDAEPDPVLSSDWRFWILPAIALSLTAALAWFSIDWRMVKAVLPGVFDDAG